MASYQDSVRCVSFVWLCILFSACLVFTTPGVLAFKFLSLPPNPPIYSGHFGLNVDMNCTTDDPNATVTLLHGSSPLSLSGRPISPSKLILNGQVFTVLNLVTSDAGVYSCKATDQSGKTIQWQGFVMLLIRTLALPKHFVLKPAKAIIVLQGQSGSVTCESEGASTVTLNWERDITGSGSYQPVPESQVEVVKDTSTNILRATLQITNARLSDSGTYKCTAKVHHLSRSRLMTIRIEAPTAPTIEPYLGSLSVKEGEQKIVKCEAKGSPKPNVTWYREGKQIDRTECGKYPKDCEGIAYEVYEEGETSPQHTPWTTAVLKIRSALYPRDQGEFKCVASNGNPPSPEKTFTFDVQASSFPNYFVLKPKKRIRVQQGQEVKVECEAEGVEETKLQWKNQTVSGDIPVPDSMVTYVKDRSKNRVRAILKIPNAQKNIQGWYKCVLLFYGKTDHNLIQIKVNKRQNKMHGNKSRRL